MREKILFDSGYLDAMRGLESMHLAVSTLTNSDDYIEITRTIFGITRLLVEIKNKAYGSEKKSRSYTVRKRRSK